MGLLSSTDKLYNMSVALNSSQASIRQDGVVGPTQPPVISNGGDGDGDGGRGFGVRG